MKRWWNEESTTGKVVYIGMAIAFLLMFFGVIDSPEYTGGGRR